MRRIGTVLAVVVAAGCGGADREREVEPPQWSPPARRTTTALRPTEDAAIGYAISLPAGVERRGGDEYGTRFGGTLEGGALLEVVVNQFHGTTLDYAVKYATAMDPAVAVLEQTDHGDGNYSVLLAPSRGGTYQETTLIRSGKRRAIGASCGTTPDRLELCRDIVESMRVLE